jgi:hypothetical protein
MSDNNQKILEKLIKENKHNYICADCDAKCPRWASVNLGIFLCYNCAGIHRGLGTHISYIKSINLDEWKDDMVKNMINHGNEKVNKKYEANLNIIKPTSNDDLEKRRYFIEKKYKNKQFYKDIENDIDNKKNIIIKNNDDINKKQYENINLLNFDVIDVNKKKENIDDLLNFPNQDNTLFFENQSSNNNNIENKIENINNLIYQQQLYQQQMNQQQLYQQQIYQQQIYQQQIYQQQIYQQQIYQQQMYQQQMYQQQNNQNLKK